MMTDVLDWWRLLNAVLGMVALVLLGRQLIRIWSEASTRARLLTMAQVYSCLIVSVASLVNAIFGFTYVGVGMTTTMVVWIIYAMLFTRHAYTQKEERGDRPTRS